MTTEKDAIQNAADLICDMTESEYARGMYEILAEMYPKQNVMLQERVQEIRWQVTHPTKQISLNLTQFDPDECYEMIFPNWLLDNMFSDTTLENLVEKLVRSRLDAEDGSDWLDANSDPLQLLETYPEVNCTFKLQLVGRPEITVVAVMESPKHSLKVYILTHNS